MLVCLLVLLMLDCLLCVGSDGDPVCLLESCRISVPGPASAPGGFMCLLGPGKDIGGEAGTYGCESWPSLEEEEGSLFPHPVLQIPTVGMR